MPMNDQPTPPISTRSLRSPIPSHSSGELHKHSNMGWGLCVGSGGNGDNFCYSRVNL